MLSPAKKEILYPKKNYPLDIFISYPILIAQPYPKHWFFLILIGNQTGEDICNLHSKDWYSEYIKDSCKINRKKFNYVMGK